MRGQEVRKLFFAHALVVALVAFVAALAPAASAAPSGYPAAGQLMWPSVTVRKAPSSTAARKMRLFELRSDLRPQIVLAIGQRRVGFRASARSAGTLTNSAGQPALGLVARDAGAAGNSLQVAIIDAPRAPDAPDTEDVFVIFQGGSELMRFPYAQSNVGELATRLNEFRAPVQASQVLVEGVGLAHGGVALAGGQNGNPGRVWLKLNLPIRPFGQTGWVPEESVDVRPTEKRILVDRSARRITVYRGSRRIFSARVAVGRPDRKTPLGNFYVAAKYRPPMNALVSGYALELSAPAGLPDFLKGGVVGIHGTPATWSIGKSASNGCVRVTNATVFRLKRIVPLGTPVKVVR
jgi:lipoprotein-anchoring transpeptidase ErfK/SrfK